MKTASLSALGALLFGLLAYLAIRLLWPGIAVQNFVNVIGVFAIAGGALGAWFARRRAGASPPPGQSSGKGD